MAKKPSTVHIKLARLSFPHLFKKHKATEDAAPKFGCDLIIDPSTPDGAKAEKDLRRAIKHVENEKWGKTGFKYKDGRGLIKDGNDNANDEGEVKNGYEDMIYLSPKADSRPNLYDRDKNAVAEEDNVFYGGCYVYGIVDVYATEKGGSKGVFASLEGLMFRKNGDSFGGQTSIDADDFEDFEDDDDEDEDEDEDEDDDDMLG